MPRESEEVKDFIYNSYPDNTQVMFFNNDSSFKEIDYYLNVMIETAPKVELTANIYYFLIDGIQFGQVLSAFKHVTDEIIFSSCKIVLHEEIDPSIFNGWKTKKV